eukprot:3191269-Amphidinium_carterae.1
MRGIVIHLTISQPHAMKFQHLPVISRVILQWQQFRLTHCSPQSRQPILCSAESISRTLVHANAVEETNHGKEGKALHMALDSQSHTTTTSYMSDVADESCSLVLQHGSAMQ